MGRRPSPSHLSPTAKNGCPHSLKFFPPWNDPRPHFFPASCPRPPTQINRHRPHPCPRAPIFAKKGHDRDISAVDESGNHISVFGARGALRPPRSERPRKHSGNDGWVTTRSRFFHPDRSTSTAALQRTRVMRYRTPTSLIAAAPPTWSTPAGPRAHNIFPSLCPAAPG